MSTNVGDSLKNLASLDLSSILTHVVDGVQMPTPTYDTLILNA